MEVLALIFGLAIGGVVGTVGGGGAILALPVLVYVLDQGVSSGSTASLIVVTLGASVGAGAHALHGYLCWRVAAAFAVPAALGAYLGTIASTSVTPRVLILAFVPVMLAAAALTYFRSGPPDDGEEDPRPCPKPQPGRSSGAGLVVGVMTGFFGVGGGFLIVPALTSLLGLPIRRAIATSLAIIGLTGLVALTAHLARGAEPDWPLTVALCVGATLGALLGSSFAQRLSPQSLAHGFGFVVAAIAVFLLVDVLLLGGPPQG
ncbi:MAG TPA: sulfite exporter TauE/SafE family protein [Solirubrobacterales bacterium]|nr:sulfite exporter TauE/SafE family protein [Solirubrobacterales bacterium]